MPRVDVDASAPLPLGGGLDVSGAACCLPALLTLWQIATLHTVTTCQPMPSAQAADPQGIGRKRGEGAKAGNCTRRGAEEA